MEKVSIIIPVFKTEGWLPDCLESCLNQTYRNIEVVLIDDGSPDKSGEICDKYASGDARIKVIHQANQGVSAARNHGLDCATGDYIVFVDSDDLVDTNAIETLLRIKAESDVEFVSCSSYSLLPDGNRKPALFHDERMTNKKEVIRRISENKIGYSVWGRLFKTDVIRKNRIRFDESIKFGEDYCFLLEYLFYVDNMITSSNAIYYYRLETWDKTRHYQQEDLEYQWNNTLMLHERYLDLFYKTDTSELFEANIAKDLIHRIHIYINNAQVYCPDIMFGGVKQLIKFELSPLYKRIHVLRFIDVPGVPEKIVLICAKYKLWGLLYIVFYIKNKLINTVNNW